MRLVLVTSLIIFLTAVTADAKEEILSSTVSLKITVSQNDMDEYYEFHKPNQFFYEKETRKHRGEKAKRAMNALLQEMDLSKQAKVDDLVSQLSKNKLKNLDFIEIRWLTDKNELYTWVWNSE